MRILILVGLTIGFVGCNRPKSAAHAPNAPRTEESPGAIVAPVSACDLLTNADIESVQGEPLQAKTPGGQPGAPMAMSQCYFATPTASKSVSVTVWQQVKATGKNPREFWNERFHGEGEKDKDSEEEEEHERLRQKLEPVANLGDEAFWSGSNVGGTLYLLKGNRFFRISVGGADDKETRIKKSRTLAEAILRRL